MILIYFDIKPLEKYKIKEQNKCSITPQGPVERNIKEIWKVKQFRYFMEKLENFRKINLTMGKIKRIMK